MQRQNYNILGFLQKQSFFQANQKKPASPNNASRFRKEPQSFNNKPQLSINKHHMMERTPPKLHSNKVQKRTPTTQQPRARNFTIKEIQKASRLKYQYQSEQRMDSPSQVTFQRDRFKTMTSPKNTPKANQQNNLPSKASKCHFQSSKVESKMCLQDLHKRVGLELELIQQLIADVTVSLQQKFYQKLNKLKLQINNMIEQMFFQAKNTMLLMLQTKKDEHLHDLLKIRHSLKDKDDKLKTLKHQMDQNWRKTAGQLLSSETDSQIDSILTNSEKIRQKMKIQTKDVQPVKYFKGKQKKYEKQYEKMDLFGEIKQIVRQLIHKYS